MPYDNVPEGRWADMDSCVQQVMADGKDKPAAIAICYTTIMGKSEGGDPIKAGARHSKADMGLINDSRRMLRQIDGNLVQLGADEQETPEQETAEQPADMEAMQSAKSPVILPHAVYIKAVTVKAAGEWALDVLAIPFGDANHRDSDGQWFSRRTQLDITPGASRPVYYYHGLTPDGKPQRQPEAIGEAKFDRTDSAGHWFRVTLDKASQWARRVWQAAQEGIAKASSGSINHLVRIAQSGEIIAWPFAELSIFDAAGDRQPANEAAVVSVAKANFHLIEVEDMDEKTINDLIAAALKAQQDAITAETNRKAEFDKAVKAEAEKLAAADRRLPFSQAPHQARYADEQMYDSLSAGDTAMLITVLESAKRNGRSNGPSIAAYKALAHKLESDKTLVGEEGRLAMKRAGMKSDEVDYSTLASYGDEWVGIAYSQQLWENVRDQAVIVNKLPSVEVPRGVESMYLPIESTDPTWYKVAEATSVDSTMKVPVPTVPSSRLGTGRVLLTLSKIGARVMWTGELEERSIIPFMAQLRSQLAVSGAEALENVIINGDTATSSNINDIGGTTYSGAATSLFLTTNGLRKSPLVTTTANSRSAAGSLAVEDYLETVKLMGTAGINALDMTKVGFIVDPNTYWATMALSEIKTRDTFASPTIEGGRLTALWGYELIQSAQMHAMSATRKANTAGKVDNDTVGNNAYGAILAVRWDQWPFGYQRRMTMETTRIANADTNEIVAMMTMGLIQRDTEASAITYYVGV